MKTFVGNRSVCAALTFLLLLAGCDDETTTQSDAATDAGGDADVTLDLELDEGDEPDAADDVAQDADEDPDGVDDVAVDVEQEPDAATDVVDDTTPDADPDAVADTVEDMQIDTIAVTFAVDDSANKDYTGGLAWNGSFTYDAATNVVRFDEDWAGPFVPLWDDGPVSDGGHEPEGATAGDHIWSMIALIAVTDAEQSIQYGALHNYVPGSSPTEPPFFGEWIWREADNGAFSVPANATNDIDLPTLVLPHHGWIDVRFSLNTANLDAAFPDPGEITSVEVKSSAWGWTQFAMVDDGSQDEVAGDDIYSFNIWANLRENRPVNGEALDLVLPGEEIEFIFVINGVEYKDASMALQQGTFAELWVGRDFIDETVWTNGRGNTAFTVLNGWVPINFSIDDTANQTYGSTCTMENPVCDGLAWKGSFIYDYQSRAMIHNETWSGPYAIVYDDGPWNEGGHEPIGATADDHIWGISAWVEVLGVAQSFGYGAIRHYVDDMPAAQAGSWIWIGENGNVKFSQSETEPVTATGLTIPAFDGTIDLLIELDTTALAGGWTFDAGSDTLTIKSSAWAWEEFNMRDDGVNGDETAGDGVYVFELSTDATIHDDLLRLNEWVGFVIIIDGADYNDSGDGLGDGVSVWSDHGVADLYEVETLYSGDGDTHIFVGEPDRVSDCTGEPDFTPCWLDTSGSGVGDLWYDICIEETCQSPGACATLECNVPGPHFTLPPADTGAIYTREEPDPSGFAGEYVVVDSITGLTWQGCHAGRTGADCTVEDTGVSETYTWADALVYCNDLVWAGYTDWYQPDEFELQSILDYGESRPAIDETAFPGTPASDYFWSSSTLEHESSNGYAWRLAFGVSGSVYGLAKASALSVRCVRREPVELPLQRYLRSEPDSSGHAGDWVVEDAITGLMWQGCAGGQTAGESACTGTGTALSYSDAGDYCSTTLNGGSYAGHSDWVLPDIKQLHSIVYNRGTPAGAPVDADAFPNTPKSHFWSSSPGTTSAWYVDFFDDGQVFTESQDELKLVRCVRQVD